MDLDKEGVSNFDECAEAVLGADKWKRLPEKNKRILGKRWNVR